MSYCFKLVWGDCSLFCFWGVVADNFAKEMKVSFNLRHFYHRGSLEKAGLFFRTLWLNFVRVAESMVGQVNNPNFVRSRRFWCETFWVDFQYQLSEFFGVTWRVFKKLDSATDFLVPKIFSKFMVFFAYFFLGSVKVILFEGSARKNILRHLIIA